MSRLDEQDAINALAYRLTEWGIEDAAAKAGTYVADLVARGWVMDAKVQKVPRNPPPGEECADHVGEWRVNCRSHAADRKAQRDELAAEAAERVRLTKEQAIATAREGIRAAVAPTRTPHNTTNTEESTHG